MTQDDVLDLILKKDDKAYTLLYDMYSKSLFAVIFNLVKARLDELLDNYIKTRDRPFCHLVRE